MTSRQRILAALNLHEPDRVPFADWIDPGIRRALARALGDETMDEGRFAQALGADALCFADESCMAPQFCKKIVDDKGAEHLQGEGFIQSRRDLDKLVLPALDTPGHFDAARRYLDRYGSGDLAIWCSLRTGMMNTIFSIGLEAFSMALYDDRGFVETVLDAFVEWNIRVVERVQEMGFDFFVAYDDIAFNSGPLFSPQVFRELFLPRMRKFADAVKIPWVYHSDGDLGLIFEDLLTLGFNGYNPFQPPVMDIEAYHEKYAGRFCFWGNIDLVHTLTNGTVEEVEDEVKRRITRLAPGGAYILGSANSITDYCKVENVLAMMAANRKYGTYPIAVS